MISQCGTTELSENHEDLRNIVSHISIRILIESMKGTGHCHSKLLCLIGILISEGIKESSVAAVCPAGRDTTLRMAVMTVTRVLRW